MTTELRSQLQSTLGATYVLERELGGGGMSRVFLAEETALRRRIVVKVLPPEMAADISVARFQREIALVARLQHPHIVPLLSSGESSGLPYFTMPYIDGESLRDRLSRDGEFPITDAVRLLREIATALAYAHGQNIVHRDIKPENVLLTGGVALVTDFGVAKALVSATIDGQAGLTSVGVALGTPAYMAPEQAAADPATDHRADIYALGIVAYEMLVGQTPFAGRSTQAVLAAHLTEMPAPIATRRPALPAPLAGLVMRCLEKRPSDRPQSANEFMGALDSLATPAPRIAALQPRSLGGISSRRAVRAGVVLLALLIVASGVWVAVARRANHGVAVSKRVLIAPFENLTGKSQFDNIGRIVSDRLAQGIAQVGSVDVVPSNTVLMMLRDTVGGQASRLQKLANVTHAELLVSGTVLLRGDSLVFQAQVSNVQTGNVVVPMQPVAGLVTDPIGAVDALGDRLLGALASRETPMIAKALQAPKYAAYQEFAAGFELFSTRGDMVGARPHFERAIAIDSSYMRAYVFLARMYINLGQYRGADSVLRQARKLPGSVNAVDRLQLDFQQAALDGDFARQLVSQQQLVARDSSATALFLIGEAAVALLQPRTAIPALERSDSAFTLTGGYAAQDHTVTFAEAYHEAGAHERELRLVEQRQGFFTNGIAVSVFKLRAYAGLKRGGKAMALVDTTLRVSSDSEGVGAFMATIAAQEFRAHGDSNTATRLLGMARAWYAAHPAGSALPGRMMVEGIALEMSGAADSAAARFAVLARDTTRIPAAGRLALAEIARGNRTRARAMADSLGALRRQYVFGANTYWSAAIIGALGDRDAAVQLLQQANREGQRMNRWHSAAELEALHGYPAFEKLVRARD